MNDEPIRVGVAGLGRAFTLMLATFRHDPRVRLVAATDPLPAARRRFEADFGGAATESVEALCARPEVEAIYIATPHQFHADHVAIAASAGKHVLVEKPMALSVEECTRMIDACDRAGVHMIVGHSHSFDAPVRLARELIESGAFGAVRMITALAYTDFLYRPRRPEELDTRAGGGVVHSQAAHQVDIVRLLAGGLVRSVRAHTGAWDEARPTEGAYAALLSFENGAFASLTYSGYGHFDSDAWMEDIGEMGEDKRGVGHGAARRRLQSAGPGRQEAELKAARNYGGDLHEDDLALPGNRQHQHFGPVIVSCDGADLQPTPSGVWVYGHEGRHLQALPRPGVPRQEVIDELWSAVRQEIPPLHGGTWARATTEVCLGLLQAARSGEPVRMRFQVPSRGGLRCHAPPGSASPAAPAEPS